MAKYTVSLAKIIDMHKFEVLYTPTAPEEIFVESADVNRPGLALAGYFDYFDPRRLQFIGHTEREYLQSLGTLAAERVDAFMEKKPVAVILSRGLEPGQLTALAQKRAVALLRTHESTSDCMASIISFLGVQLAERMDQHGVLVEVAGQGVLITGESGIGKTECALELVRRGHRLIADDRVEIRRVSSTTLVGAAPDNIRNFLELRGVGLLNVQYLFGTGAVKDTERIDLVLAMERWEDGKAYERLGDVQAYTEILGIRVPIVTVPISPGRNLAIIIEAAVMNNRAKKGGYNAALDFMARMETPDPEVIKNFWYSM
ncbi:MAG: HPr(Ser) kinase/phosphatase [Oscillospiraceae bacterium]|jgi:HPr kinase/phosphorylase|nr:HPr(Ser) kinase/phosphatase [Oscillospiraceae bacterium]